MKGLFWLRDDLRFHDHPVLRQFSEECEHGFFIWTPTRSFSRAGPRRRQFILASVLEFQKKAQDRGAVCLISHLPVQDLFPALLEKTQVQKIYFSSAITHEELEDEQRVRELGLPIVTRDTGALIAPDNLPMTISAVPESFTKFRTSVEPTLRIDPPAADPLNLPSWESTEIELLCPLPADFLKTSVRPHLQLRGGESFGLSRVHDYIWAADALKSYKQTRNGLLNWNDSSKISPWLAVGALSARFVFAEIQRYEENRVRNESTYWLFFELLWRDYFRLIAQKWGAQFFVGKTKVNRLPPVKTLEVDDLFDRWCQGLTEDDFVNANMRELSQTGWMSNRGRQNVASYLCKQLGVDWRRGAAYFEQQLIDYDPCSNWGNWAYQAGAGQDGRDRAFDTQKQAALYDPDLRYRKLWLGY